jgi:hypothetical protein
MTTFEARYHSRCEACDGHITPGDDVKWDGDLDGGRVIHVDCDAPVVDFNRPSPAPCPKCHVVPAQTGDCWCET